MTETEGKIIDAAIGCFVRFGARKASMNDIAGAAGVSRQTLYDLFGSKDELIRASIQKITDQSLAAIAVRLQASTTLEEKLNAYFQETVIKSFELLQIAGDPEDLISGHNEAGAAAIRDSHDKYKHLIEGILTDNMEAPSEGAISPAGLADYVVTVAMGFKYVKDRGNLEDLLAVLTASVLKLVRP